MGLSLEASPSDAPPVHSPPHTTDGPRCHGSRERQRCQHSSTSGRDYAEAGSIFRAHRSYPCCAVVGSFDHRGLPKSEGPF
ncbi:hypothetical protein C2845_PM04G28820 [Panicum miliaceum]|uniref:Uncharacterized protein n=1 Tax=Panicum miliaceum TaxID=4540 RepID=A0A3L6QMC0_PANMI|nr:hypothetical protein C2845_PM04G28820 [Panicum miliaceum]